MKRFINVTKMHRQKVQKVQKVHAKLVTGGGVGRYADWVLPIPQPLNSGI